MGIARRTVAALRPLLYPFAASAEAMFDYSATRSDVVAARQVLSADRSIDAVRRGYIAANPCLT